MQQRRLRLGDILDDYCPRERRITNHVIVAMIEDQVRQTRCTTCDADHAYKQAKVPAPRRKKDGAPAGEPVDPARPSAAAADVEASDEDQLPDDVFDADAPVEATVSATAQTDSESTASVDLDDPAPAGDDEGPVHRRLIRATLPRPEGQAPERKISEFTVRQPGGHGRGDFDANRGGGDGQQRFGHGRRTMRGHHQPGQSAGGPSRFGGSRQGPSEGPRQNGNRSAPPGGQRGGGGRPGQGTPRGPRPPGRKRGR